MPRGAGGAGVALPDSGPGDVALGERRPRSLPDALRCGGRAPRALAPARAAPSTTIAQNLTISFNTAKSHIRHIYVKADVHSRQELIDLIDRER
ncbi:MAG: LuxR C-terminal-related transcriptional regulator [Adlercreutzia equolifaciens]